MNKVTLVGRIVHRPFLAETTGGHAVATIHLCVERSSNVSSPPDEAQEVPCVVSQRHLSEILRWRDEGFLIAVDGHLRRQTLWYGDRAGLNTMQVFAERVVRVIPRTHPAPPEES